MVDKWSTNSSNGESGILRKSTHQHHIQSSSKKNNLEVFGYACKIFREDDKARYIDQGKHLIPWMGEQSLKIDRYDVRATLNDLVQYEVPMGGYTNRLDYLSPAEQKAEQLCEEERYFSLYHNDQNEQMYQEEELKRLQQMVSSSYGQVGFNYDTNSPSAVENEEINDNEEPEEQDEIFVPIANFDIPDDIELPNTMKEHAIIEKTARFISTQGAQMEILIKTKQANNSQFDFLMQNHRLYGYYKHVHNAIKNSTYPKEKVPENEITQETTDDTTNQNNRFLQENPYFSQLSLRTTIPTIVYTPSADCSYTQLISKITGVPLPIEKSDTKAIQSDIDLVQNNESNSSSPTTTPTQYEETTNFEFNPYYSTQPLAVYTPPLPSTDLIIKPNHIENFIQNSDGVEVKKISTGLMLAQYYNTDSESDESNEDNLEEELNFPFPPESLKNIIDKTAIYVIKNGKNFEDILRTKEDLRFSFLDDTSEFHNYYIYKVTGKPPIIKSENGIKNPTSDHSVKTKVITPVSFSIKAKDEQTIPIKVVLLQEQSSDEDDKLDNKNKIKTNDTKLSALGNIIEQTPPEEIIETATINTEQKNIPETLDLITDIISGQSSIKNDSVQVKSQNKEAKKISDEKLRDKLAAAAREKMGCISKEKQLQLERKKKAMAFLTQMKIPSVQATKSSDCGITDLTKDILGGNDSDVESCHSIPTSPIIPQRKTDTNNTNQAIHIKNLSRSRSRSKSSSSRHKKRKSKSHSKKKTSKRKSRSRSRSRSRESKYRKHSSSHRSNDSVRHSRYRDE